LSISEKFVFVHVPKTAGTSFRKLLVDIFTEDQVSPQFMAKPLTDEDATRLDRFQVIAGHVSFADVYKYFPDRRLITFLREPVDRCLSIYGFYREMKGHPLIPLNEILYENNPFEATSLAKQLSPDEFFDTNHPHIMQNVSNRTVWQLGHYASVERRIGFADSEILEAAKSNLKQCDFVGFFENLDNDVAYFLKKFKISDNVVLPKINRTITAVRKSQISQELVEKISKLNELDNEIYKWAKCEFSRD